MSRMPRVLLFAALCVLPSIACGQVGPSADGDDHHDHKHPAPGEPSGKSAGTSTADETPQKYERTPDAIPGTELGEPSSKPPLDDSFDAQAELSKLRQEFEARIGDLETRLDQQIARLDSLQQADMKLADGKGETTTANKPVNEANTDDEPEAKGDTKATPGDRGTELTRLRSELEKLQADYADLFAQLKDQQTGQDALARQLRDAALGSPSGGAGAPSVLGNMQADPKLRSELYRNTRYRLRIHNTSGSELPISVNGVQWTVRADEWTFVPVPYGPVTVHQPGHEPLEISEEHVNWHADSRGFYVDYDYQGNQTPTSSGNPPAKPSAE